MSEPDPDLPWEVSDSTLARAARAAFQRVNVHDASSGQFVQLNGSDPDNERLVREHMLGGFDYDVDELHVIAHALGEAHSYQLATHLADALVDSDSPAYEEALDAVLAGLARAGATGLFKGVFQIGVVIGELEARASRGEPS